MTEQEQEKTTLSVFITGGAAPAAIDTMRRLVANGHRVASFAKTSAEASLIRAEGALPVYGDPNDSAVLRNILKMAEVDTIIHLATQQYNLPPYVKRDWSSAAVQYQKELDALLTAAREVGVSYILLASFAFLYADSTEPVDETAPLRSSGDHPFIKAALAAEKAVLKMGGGVLRIGHMYGVKESLRFAQVMIRRGLPLYYGQSNSVTNWLHEADLAGAVVAAAEKQEAGAVFNIVSDTPMSVQTFMATFAEKTGLTLPPNMPPFMGNLQGKAQADLLNVAVAAKNDRAKSELGWSPRFGSVDAGLEDILLTWRATA